MAEKQTAGRDMLGEFAPKFAELYSMKIKKQTRKQAAGSTGVRQGDADEV